MRDIYLVKKDENKTGPDNWIVMDSHQYWEFLQTEDGKRRDANVALLNKRSENDRNIHIECEPEKAKEIKSEYDHGLYIARWFEKIGYQIVSYHGMIFANEKKNGEEIIPDEDTDLEEQVIHEMELASLRSAITRLNQKDRDIIMGFFFSEDPQAIAKLAEKYGMKKAKVYKRKERILHNLKKTLQGEG